MSVQMEKKTLAKIVSIFYWFYTIIIPIGPFLCFVFICVDTSVRFTQEHDNANLGDGVAKVGYDNALFNARFWEFIYSLNSQGGHKYLSNNVPLYVSLCCAYFFGLIYLMIQIVLNTNLGRGISTQNFWHVNAWYEGQLMIVLINIFPPMVFFVGVPNWIAAIILALNVSIILFMVVQMNIIKSYLDEIKPKQDEKAEEAHATPFSKSFGMPNWKFETGLGSWWVKRGQQQ